MRTNSDRGQGSGTGLIDAVVKVRPLVSADQLKALS